METHSLNPESHFSRSHGCIIALTSLFILLAACVALGIFLPAIGGRPPSVWQNPPLYPGAADLQVADYGEHGTPEITKDGYAGILVMKVMTYTVQAPEADVVSFYRQAFSSGGFHPDDTSYGRALPPVKTLNFSWTGAGRSPTDFYLDLITNSVDSEHIRVEIGVSESPGY